MLLRRLIVALGLLALLGLNPAAAGAHTAAALRPAAAAATDAAGNTSEFSQCTTATVGYLIELPLIWKH